MSEPFKVAEQAKLDAGKHWESRVINGEFHLREYLGGSGHSAVFLTDLYDRDSHTAAIKIVAADSPSGQALLNSCELAASLSHPNLIHILTAGRAQIDGVNAVYAVVEYAEENLAQVIAQRALTGEEAREMLGPALRALSYVHARGLAHARLKPGNILASGDQLKISADSVQHFGEPVTDSSIYNAPECTASPGADSWSLGMTLVEVLSQRLPEWNRESGEDPTVSESLPEPFREIVRNCLRRDPKLRWTSDAIASYLDPSALRAAAQSSAAEESLLERRSTPFEATLEAARASYEVPAASRKRNASAYLIPAVLFCAVLAGLLLWLARDSSSKLSSQPPLAASVPAPAPVVAPVIPPQPVASAYATKPELTAVRKPTAPAKKTPSVIASPLANASPESPAGSTAAVVSGPASPEPGTSEGVLRQVLPKVSQKALDTIHGNVRVSVLVDVDSAGTVKFAKLDSPGPSQYFANEALGAAREWKFASADRPSQRLLHFVFMSSGVNASISSQ